MLHVVFAPSSRKTFPRDCSCINTGGVQKREKVLGGYTRKVHLHESDSTEVTGAPNRSGEIYYPEMVAIWKVLNLYLGLLHKGSNRLGFTFFPAI